MAVKTFTTGEVLTSADTNTYLANSGLVFVKSQTVGSGVSSVEVTGAFSSTYDNYKILWTTGTASTGGTQIRLQMGATATGYKTNLIYQVWNASTVLGANGGSTNFQFIGGEKSGSANGPLYVECDLKNPFLSKYTFMSSQMYGGDTTSGTTTGVLTNTTSYTAFTFSPDAGTLTGGEIVVYGYRKG